MRFLRTLSLIALILSCPLAATSEQVQWGREFSMYAREASDHLNELCEDISLFRKGLDIYDPDYFVCENLYRDLFLAAQHMLATANVSEITVSCGCKDEVAWVRLGDHLGMARVAVKTLQMHLGMVENDILADQTHEAKKYLDGVITDLEEAVPSEFRDIVFERMDGVVQRLGP